MERQCEALASGVNWVGADNLFGARFRERRFGPETTVLNHGLRASKSMTMAWSSLAFDKP